MCVLVCVCCLLLLYIGLQLAVNAKITGPYIYEAGGWFIRFNSGTPATLTFTNVEVCVYVLCGWVGVCMNVSGCV